jgi:hypothetical protein
LWLRVTMISSGASVGDVRIRFISVSIHSASHMFS